VKAVRKITIPEIRYRLQQYAWNRLNVICSTKYCQERKDRLFEPFIRKRFLVSENELQKIATSINTHNAEYTQDLLGKAEAVCRGEFNLLGLNRISYKHNDRIDWHRNPLSSVRTPFLSWININNRHLKDAGDLKVIWELNRHQFMILLGMAYRLSGNQKYRLEFIRQMEGWFISNCPKKGVNWLSSLEMAFRCISWIWAFHLFSGASRPFHHAFTSDLMRYMEIQGEHIEHNLSYYFSPNTHLTGEALGLLYIGLFLHSERSSRWIQIGSRILQEELERHILPDGGCMERSFWYHRYTLEIYLHYLLLCRYYKVEVPENLEGKIESMGEFLMYAMQPDGTFPLIGDDDGGCLIPLDELKGNDVRGIMSTLAALYGRGDFKYVSKEYRDHTLWMLGCDSHKGYEAIRSFTPDRESNGFKNTGFFFLRSGWSDSSNYMAFKCGPHGWLNGGHAHADLLSIHITAGKEPVIVDPGTYTYCEPWRNYFRRAENHSSITVDGAHPTEPAEPFHWKRVSHHCLIKWKPGREYDHVIGCLSGDTEWKHTREIIFYKPDVFVINDSLHGGGKHLIKLNYPLGGTEWRLERNVCIRNKHMIECLNPELIPQLEDLWISSYYGEKHLSKKLVFSGRISLPCHITTIIRLNNRNA
jgi:hypothetical protein